MWESEKMLNNMGSVDQNDGFFWKHFQLARQLPLLILYLKGGREKRESCL